jgi:hypothetical protein
MHHETVVQDHPACLVAHLLRRMLRREAGCGQRPDSGVLRAGSLRNRGFDHRCVAG